MAKQTIDIGVLPNDDTGDSLRDGGDKINDNFNEVYSSFGDGTNLLNAVDNNLNFNLQNSPHKISFYYATKTQLDSISPTDYKGCIAYVESTGSLYYANNGRWSKLLTNTSFAQNDPNYSEVLSKVAYGGNLQDLTNVDESVSPDDGYVLKWNSTKSKWEPAVDIAAAGVGLNATTLSGQPASYYLNYTNLVNTPSIPTNISELENDEFFVSFNENDEVLEFYNETANTTLTIDTDHIPEGNTNYYYTLQRFLSDFQQNFDVVARFDRGNSIDSVYECQAQFSNITNNQSRNVVNVAKINNFRVGENIRIYGADDDNIGLVKTSNLQIDSVETVNFSPGPYTIRYNAAEMDINTGKITARYYGTDDINRRVNIDNLDFNKDRNIQLQIGFIPSDKVLLLYRSVNSTNNNQFRLFAIISRKDLNNSGYFIDYYNFDHTPWGGKDSSDNTYPSSLLHVPTSPPTSTKRGWVDVQIDEVNYLTNTIEINRDVYVDSPATLINIAHNDSQLILDGIDNAKANGRNTLLLNDKTYVVESIKLPSNFTLLGTPGVTRITKLPWSNNPDALLPSPNKNIIKSENYNYTTGITEGVENSSIQSIIFDCNMIHSYLLDDSMKDELNYAINLGTGSKNVFLKNVKFLNVVGGGIYMPKSEDFIITESDFFNSGLTDRNDNKAMFATELENSRITENRFANFSDNVDISTADKVVITDNVIDGCGSGLYVFASKNLISYPNVLLGYGGELLPTPDILNSEYDSINIHLTNGVPYVSDSYVYQENGEIFDLTANSGTLKYNLYVVEKANTGVEVLSDYPDANVSLNEVVGTNKTEGEFKFAITSSDVDHIKETLKTHDVAYTVNLEEIVPAGNLGAGSTSNSEYEVFTTDEFKYLYVGAKVTFTNHFNYDAGIGTIESISGGGVVVSGLNLNGNGSGGNINIINEFVLAQGRVL